MQVFDCGLLGEGALHIAAAIQANALLAPGGTVLPARATVYAQPIEYQRLSSFLCGNAGTLAEAAPTGSPSGGLRSSASQQLVDLAPLNRYAWGSREYRAVDLARTGMHSPSPVWRALAPPQAVFSFNFTAAAPGQNGSSGTSSSSGSGSGVFDTFGPASKSLSATVNVDGCCNAIASWFELDLAGDGSVCLTTSPYHSMEAAAAPHSSYAGSWLQAVHPVAAARKLQVGQQLVMTASHDTYSIKFDLASPQAPAAAGHGSWSTRGNAAAGATSGGGGANAGSVEVGACREGGSARGGGGEEGLQQFDDVWLARFEEVQVLQAQLGRQAAQQPQRHRAVVQAALALAARPVTGGADGRQAVGLLANMMM